MIRHARMLVTALGIAAITSATPAAAQQSDRPTIAVVTFNNNVPRREASRYEGLGTGIADLLASALRTNASVRVAERGAVQPAITAQQLPAGVRLTRDAAVKVGKSLTVQHTVFGGFTVDPQGNVRIDARMADANTGVIEDVERGQDRSENIVALIDRLAVQLTSVARLPGAPAPTTGAAARLSLQQLATYGRGLELADRGDRAQASEQFNAVLKDFPDFAPARAALARLGPGR
jgi:TolB-like protein